MSNRVKYLSNGFAIIIMLEVTFFTILKLSFGVELTDEAYSVAESYLVSKGALPFVDNWSQMPGWTLLTAPFVKLYTIINHDTEGIFAFFRLLTFFINVVTAFIVFILIKDLVDNPFYRLLSVVIFFGASGLVGMGPFRGDNLMIDLYAVGSVMLSKEFVKNVYNKINVFICGIIFALAVLCYPVFISIYIYLVLFMIYMIARKKQKIDFVASFVFGSVFTAIIVVGYLMQKNGLAGIIHGIKCILSDVTYFRIEHEGVAKIPSYFILMISKNAVLLIGLSICTFFSVCIKRLRRKKDRQITNVYDESISISFGLLDKIFLLSVFTTLCVCCFYQVIKFGTVDNGNVYIYSITYQFIVTLYVFPFIKKYKKYAQALLSVVWIPSAILVVITGVSTNAPIINRHFLFENTVFVLVLFFIWAWNDNANTVDIHNSECRIANKLNDIIVPFLPAFLVMTITFVNLFNSYSLFYREPSFRELTERVDEGVYKGLKTTEARARGIEELERVLKLYTNEDDYVLAMDNCPFIYTMIESHACTPSSWDMTLYSYGFNEPQLYYDYFDVTGIEPSKIIYFNYGRDAVLSIDTEYMFNEFVESKYCLIYENRDFWKWNYCGNDVICELLIYERIE